MPLLKLELFFEYIPKASTSLPYNQLIELPSSNFFCSNLGKEYVINISNGGERDKQESKKGKMINLHNDFVMQTSPLPSLCVTLQQEYKKLVL